MATILRNEILSLRALEPTDVDLLYEWENDTSLWNIGNSITPYSRYILWEYLKNYDGDPYKSHQIRLMIELADGTSIGTVDLYDFDPFNGHISVGLLISGEYRHKGYGRQTMSLVSDYCVRFLGIRSILAKIPVDNIHSRGLFEKCGFVCIGTLHQWLRRGQSYVDVCLYQSVDK